MKINLLSIDIHITSIFNENEILLSMTCREAHLKLEKEIKKAMEQYPEMNPFHPSNPRYKEWNEAANKEMEEIIKEIITNRPTSG